jgi:hypothetical protein
LVCNDRLYDSFFQLVQEKISLLKIKDGGTTKIEKKEWNRLNDLWAARERFSLLTFVRSNLYYEVLLK